jgi:hypothetical protein
MGAAARGEGVDGRGLNPGRVVTGMSPDGLARKPGDDLTDDLIGTVG